MVQKCLLALSMVGLIFSIAAMRVSDTNANASIQKHTITGTGYACTPDCTGIGFVCQASPNIHYQTLTYWRRMTCQPGYFWDGCTNGTAGPVNCYILETWADQGSCGILPPLSSVTVTVVECG